MWGRRHFSLSAGGGVSARRFSLLATVCLALSSCSDEKKAESGPEKPFVFTIDVSFAHRVDYLSEEYKLRISFASGDKKIDFGIDGFAPTEAAVFDSGVYVLGKYEKINQKTLGRFKYHSNELLYCTFVDLICRSIYKNDEGFLSNITRNKENVYLLEDTFISTVEGANPVNTSIQIFNNGKLSSNILKLGAIKNIFLRDNKIIAIVSSDQIKWINHGDLGIHKIYDVSEDVPQIIDTDSALWRRDPFCFKIYVKNDLLICSYIYENADTFIITEGQSNSKIREIYSGSASIFVDNDRLKFIGVDGSEVNIELRQNKGG